METEKIVDVVVKKRKLVIETDLGHDPDDLFAVCYLHSAGYDIKALLLSPGHPYQVALARMLCKTIGIDARIGVSKKSDGSKDEAQLNGGFHTYLLDLYWDKDSETCDELGKDVLADVLREHPDCELFICGPAKSTGRFVMDNPGVAIPAVWFQGGFLGYAQHGHSVPRLPAFEGRLTCPTFNLNGAAAESKAIIAHPGIGSLSFISKNLCHTVVYNQQQHEFMQGGEDLSWLKKRNTMNKADQMFMHAMDIYLERHTSKKFHDPTAACVMKHPEIAKWVYGVPYREANGEWGTRLDENSRTRIIASIDYRLLWKHLRDKD